MLECDSTDKREGGDGGGRSIPPTSISSSSSIPHTDTPETATSIENKSLNEGTDERTSTGTDTGIVKCQVKYRGDV
jgi:hypothetical protein